MHFGLSRKTTLLSFLYVLPCNFDLSHKQKVKYLLKIKDLLKLAIIIYNNSTVNKLTFVMRFNRDTDK